jgi:hypothetical protein
MKKIYLLLSFSLLSMASYAQIVINEVQPATNTVELKNLGTQAVDVSNYYFCSFPSYGKLSAATLVSGSLNVAPNELVVFILKYNLGIADDELGIYSSPSYSSSNAIVDYVEWGSTGHQRSSVGVGAGTWTSGDFVTGVSDQKIMAFDGQGNQDSDYKVVDLASFGAENPVATGLNNSEAKASVSIYPNPVTGDKLHIDSEKISSFEVIDMNGNTLLKGDVNEVDFTSFSKGMYCLKISFTTGETQYQVVQRF